MILQGEHQIKDPYLQITFDEYLQLKRLSEFLQLSNQVNTSLLELQNNAAKLVKLIVDSVYEPLQVKVNERIVKIAVVPEYYSKQDKVKLLYISDYFNTIYHLPSDKILFNSDLPYCYDIHRNCYYKVASADIYKWFLENFLDIIHAINQHLQQRNNELKSALQHIKNIDLLKNVL